MTEITVFKERDENQYRDNIYFTVSEKLNAIKFDFQSSNCQWMQCLIKETGGKIRGQLVSNKNEMTIIIGKEKQYSPNTQSGDLVTGVWEIEVVGIFGEDLKIGDKLFDLGITEYPEDGENEIPDLYQEKIEVWENMHDTEKFSVSCFNQNRKMTTGEKWYKGDLHTHTIFSDGKMTPSENLAQSLAMNLDFFVATDHNLIPTSWPQSANLLVIPGIEVTSPFGHYNQLQVTTHPFQETGYQLLYNSQELSNSLNKAADATHLNSVNHPFLTEWKWLAKETQLAKIDLMEIWNDPTYVYNPVATEQALDAWDVLLKDGYRITGVGGSDSHLRPDETYPESSSPSLIGDPGTFVYAEELSSKAIMESLKAGKVYVSRFDCHLHLTVNQHPIGSCMPANTESLQGKCSHDFPKNLWFEWIIDSEIYQETFGKESECVFEDNDGAAHYIRVNLRDDRKQLIAFSNPIFIGEKTPQLKNWGDLLDCL